MQLCFNLSIPRAARAYTGGAAGWGRVRHLRAVGHAAEGKAQLRIAEARLAAQQEKERILRQERQEVVDILVQAAEKMVREKETSHD